MKKPPVSQNQIRTAKFANSVRRSETLKQGDKLLIPPVTVFFAEHLGFGKTLVHSSLSAVVFEITAVDYNWYRAVSRNLLPTRILTLPKVAARAYETRIVTDDKSVSNWDHFLFFGN